MKRWQAILLGVLISAATLYYAFHGVAWDQLGDVLGRGKYIYVVPSAILAALGLGLRGYRWRALLNKRIEIGHSINILNASYLFNTILPLRLGEIVRGYLATRLQPPISIFTALSSVVVERLLDVLVVVVFIVLAILMAPVAPEIAATAEMGGVLTVVGIVVLTAFAARRSLAHAVLDVILRVIPALERFNLRGLLDRLLDGIAPLGSLRGALTAFGWTGIAWFASVLSTYVLLYTFFDKPQINAALLLTAIASLAIAIPAMPGNIGPFEAAVIFRPTTRCLGLAAQPHHQASALSTPGLLHITNTAPYLVLRPDVPAPQP